MRIRARLITPEAAARTAASQPGDPEPRTGEVRVCFTDALPPGWVQVMPGKNRGEYVVALDEPDEEGDEG